MRGRAFPPSELHLEGERWNRPPRPNQFIYVPEDVWKQAHKRALTEGFIYPGVQALVEGWVRAYAAGDLDAVGR